MKKNTKQAQIPEQIDLCPYVREFDYHSPQVQEILAQAKREVAQMLQSTQVDRQKLHRFRNRIQTIKYGVYEKHSLSTSSCF